MRSIVIKKKEDVTLVLTAIYDTNCATENSHVKTNLVHTLHRMQKIEQLEVSKFSTLLSPDKMATAKKAADALKDNKPWYTLPRAKFLEYIHSISALFHQIDSCRIRAL